MNWHLICPHIKLALAIVGTTLGFHSAMFLVARALAGGWWKDAIQNDHTELPSAKILDESTAPPLQWVVRLEEMYSDVRRHSGIQLKSFLSMQYSYYAVTMTWTVLAAVGSLLGVFVIKEGWEKANPYLINAALTVTVLLTFWQAIPKMLSMSSNIAAAKKAYLSCVQLGNEIRSFARQSHSATPNRTADDIEADFINKAGKRFSEIRNLNFDIDTSQAPDYRKAIQDQMKSQ